MTNLAIKWGRHYETSGDLTGVRIAAPACLYGDINRPKLFLKMHEQLLSFWDCLQLESWMFCYREQVPFWKQKEFFFL